MSLAESIEISEHLIHDLDDRLTALLNNVVELANIAKHHRNFSGVVGEEVFSLTQKTTRNLEVVEPLDYKVGHQHLHAVVGMRRLVDDS